MTLKNRAESKCRGTLVGAGPGAWVLFLGDGKPKSLAGKLADLTIFPSIFLVAVMLRNNSHTMQFTIKRAQCNLCVCVYSTTNLFFVFIAMPSLDISYKWTHVICDFL